MIRNGSSVTLTAPYNSATAPSGIVAAPAKRTGSTDKARWLVFGVALTLLLLNLWSPAHPNWLERLLASSIVIISAVPAWLWASKRTTGSPFMVFFGAIYGLYYGLPILVVEHYERLVYYGSSFYSNSTVIPDDILEQALFIALLGICVLFVSYYKFGRAFDRLLPRLKMDWTDVGSLKLTIVPLGVLGMAAYYTQAAVQIPLQIAQFLVLLSDLCPIVITILFMLQLNQKLRLGGILFLWAGLVLPRLLIGFATGRTAQGMEIILLLLVTLAAVRRKVPVVPLLCGAVLLFVFLPIKQEFRNLTWIGWDANKSLVQKAGIYVSVVTDYVSGKSVPFSDGIQITMQRVAHILTLADVVHLTPGVVPYWMGETYYPLLLKLIPRFLYPDKPQEDSGQAFGHRYGFLDRTDIETSYNLPQLIEFYVNFGYVGVIIGMLILGLIYRSVDCMCFHPAAGIGATVAGLYILSKLLTIEVVLSIVLGGIILGIGLLALLHFAVKVMQSRFGSSAL